MKTAVFMYIGTKLQAPTEEFSTLGNNLAVNSFIPWHCQGGQRLGFLALGTLSTIDFQISQIKGTIARSKVQWELRCLVISRESI